MKVQAIVDVRHGVTQQITCPLGSIFHVTEIVMNPECPDFREVGIIPQPGAWYKFRETGDGMVHNSACFQVIPEPRNLNDFKFFH